MIFQTSDNNINNPLSVTSHDDLLNLSMLSSKSLSELINNNPELLVFPESFDSAIDGLDEYNVFDLSMAEDGGYLTCGNVVGFIGVCDNNTCTELSIHSRFSNNENDYLLHYILQRVMHINLFNLEHSFSQEDSLFDFLRYLFPNALKNAVIQGLYKEYVTKSYNDHYIHGTIDIPSFVNKNIPFNGRISSRAREYNFDNSMTQLIRHTIEYLSTDLIGQRILSSDKEIINAVSIIKNSTPTYNKFRRNKVISDNLRGKRHPFFTRYDALRKLCIQILRHEGLRYSPSQTEKKVYGVLFDVAWLWEEYINCIFNDYSFSIIHSQNKIGGNGIYLFINPKRYIRYPDFYFSDNSLVMDAKYKHLMKTYAGSPIDTIDRNDMHQLVAYMYMLRAKRSAFLFPSIESTSKKLIGKLGEGDIGGYEGDMYLCSLKIPQNNISYQDFVVMLHNEEKVFAENVRSLHGFS